ncbi:MAG: alkaline phosphatase [Chthoniobacterales bacterium]
MKWRNQLLALFCLLAFLGFGVFYFQYWVVQKPFGIILFIAEGFDAQTLAAMRLRVSETEKSLALDSFPYSALLDNHSADAPVPDPAAAATALATGVRVRNGAVAIDPIGNRLTSILELARARGRTTGLVTDGSVTAPVVASFYGHAQPDEAAPDFARQLADDAAIDVILGGGKSDFLPTGQGGRRADERDLVGVMRDANYEFVQSLAELEAVPRWRRAKLFGLFTDGALPLTTQLEGEDTRPTLADLVRRGIELLQFHRGGYLLVVDASLMRKARQDGEGEQEVNEALAFERAVTAATQYAGKTSAIFICADVANRADVKHVIPLDLSGEFPPIFSAQPDADTLLLGGLKGQSLPEFPARDRAEWGGRVGSATSSSQMLSAILAPSRPAPPEDVISFGTGLGADALKGTLENTALFDIMRDNL